MDRDSLRSGGGGVARRSKSQSRGSMQQQQRKPFGVPSVPTNSGDAPARVGSSSALFDSCGGQSSRVSDAQSALYESIDDDIIYDQGRWRNYFPSLVVLFFFFLCVWWIDHLAHFPSFISGRVNNSSLWCCPGTIKMMGRPPTPANQNNAFNFVVVVAGCWWFP